MAMKSEAHLTGAEHPWKWKKLGHGIFFIGK